MVARLITSFTILLIFTISCYASEYDKFYDSGGSGSGRSYSDSLDDDDAKKYDPNKHYEDDPIVILPDADSIFDKFGDTDYRTQGKATGSSVTNKVGSEGALRGNILDPMQQQTEMTTLGDTFICSTDNSTYPSRDLCTEECDSGCESYFFKSEMTCQKSEEVVSVTPSHLGSRPKFTIIYRDSKLTTEPVDAVCQNGYKSGLMSYIWYVEKDELKVRTAIKNNNVSSGSGLGICEDVKNKTVLSYPTNFYNNMGIAFLNLLSKQGLVVTTPQIVTKGSMVGLSISSIVAGACNSNELQSSFENSELIHAASDGSRPIDANAAKDIAEDDPIYNALVSGKSYSLFNCSITFKLTEKDGVLTNHPTNNCSAVKKNCNIVSEKICDLNGKRCTYAIQNSISTNNKIPIYCNTIILAGEEHKVCADGTNIILSGEIFNLSYAGKYFKIDREYECIDETEDDYDYSDFIDQQTIIGDTATIADDGTYTYSYKDKDGNIQVSKSKYELNDLECLKSCKVQMPAEIATDNSSTLFDDGTSSGLKIDPIIWRSCDLKDGVDWVCNIASDEILIKDCDCMDDFIDTYIQLKTADEITKNQKCSTK